MVTLALALMGCTPDDGADPPVVPPLVTVPDTGSTTPTGDTGTGQTTPPPLEYDCTQPLPTGPYEIRATGFVTQEDFDFHPDGWLVSGTLVGNIQGLNREGEVRVFATGLSGNIAGIRVLHSLDIALANQSQGGLQVVNQAGSSTMLVSGLNSANAVAADSRDFVYIAEYWNNGRLIQVQPYDGSSSTTVHPSLDRPNGMVLSPDENTMYVIEDGSRRIVTIPRTGDRVWGTPSVFWQFPQGMFITLDVDICGNLYTVEYSSGEVYRILADGSSAEPLFDIQDFGLYSALHFGNGAGGWERETLYISRRGEVYAIDVGIPGREPVYPVVAPP